MSSRSNWANALLCLAGRHLGLGEGKTSLPRRVSLFSIVRRGFEQERHTSSLPLRICILVGNPEQPHPGLMRDRALISSLAKASTLVLIADVLRGSALARPVSWLPRLHVITKTVMNSVRSHYDRGDLERLFELQPRAAQKMLEMLPIVQVGTSRLLDREVLLRFLERVREADDVPALYVQILSEKVRVSQRKPRSLVRSDLPPVSLDSLPSSITLSRGRMEVNFTTVVDLAEAMFALARILESEGEEFAQSFELPKTTAIS
jgi:hypothetical protein